MRKAFMCSLCHNGILGGALYLDHESVTFLCQKLTVDKKYRKLSLPLTEINTITWKRIVFSIAAFRMKTGEEYKFLIYNKRRFEKYFRKYSRSK